MEIDFDSIHTFNLPSFIKETERHCEIRDILNDICYAQEGVHQMHDCWVIADTFAYNLGLFIDNGQHQQNFNICLASIRYAEAFAPFLADKMRGMISECMGEA